MFVKTASPCFVCYADETNGKNFQIYLVKHIRHKRAMIHIFSLALESVGKGREKAKKNRQKKVPQLRIPMLNSYFLPALLLPSIC
jgi:hypothetical protein